jgi:hypothetical protein
LGSKKADSDLESASSTRQEIYEQVEFQFLSLTEADTLLGTVLLRESEMVIDIQEDDGTTVYLIRGKSFKHFFEGANSAGSSMPRARARWVGFGREYVGKWIEGGQEYLFSLELHD